MSVGQVEQQGGNNIPGKPGIKISKREIDLAYEQQQKQHILEAL